MLQGQCIITKLLICWGDSTIYTSPAPSLIVWHLFAAEKKHTAGEVWEASQSVKAFQTPQWLNSCHPGLHKERFPRGKREKKKRKKNLMGREFLFYFFLRSLFDRGNIKIGAILASTHRATVREFKITGKWFASPQCWDVAEMWFGKCAIHQASGI